MKIKRIDTNQTELDLGANIVLFSYDTPVAYYSIMDNRYFVTDKWYSKTTTKHINAFTGDSEATEVRQEEIDSLVV